MSLFDKLKAMVGAKPPANDGAEQDPDEPKTRTTPKEDARLEAEGRALFEAGDAASAISLLGTRGILFARHELTALPCLCKRCLRPEVSTAEGGGVPYARDFVVTKHRVFFYWMPVELAEDAKQVRASVRGELRSRLRVLATKEEQPRQGINPFTKEPITILPKQARRPRINPFTGKPVP